MSLPTAKGFTDLHALLAQLRRQGEIVEIEAEVDPDLEAAEIHRRVIAAGGPALLFSRVKGADFPVVTNLFGTKRRVELAFGPRPERLIERIASLPQKLMPPSLGGLWKERDLFGSLLKVGRRKRRHGPVTEVTETPPRLGRLPLLRSWSKDGGAFLTLPLCHTEHPDGLGSNLGMYRVQRHAEDRVGLHMQIVRGGGAHLAAYEQRAAAMPINIHVGGPPALILAAIAPLPENVPELMLGSLVMGRRLPMAENPLGPLPVIASSDFVLVGEVPPGIREAEGPFGDHYGYYSLQHDYPTVEVKGLLRRRNPILSATVVGKPRQEDFFIGDYLQELLSPLIRLVMPQVKDVWAYGETGYHGLAGAIVEERFRHESMMSAFRILGEGQLSLTKFLLLTDQAVDLRDFRATFEHVLARCRFESDLYIFSNLSMDTLDYTGPAVNEGSKGVLRGLGDPVRELPRHLEGELPIGFTKAITFCRGCLVVEGPSHASEPTAAERLAHCPALTDWPIVVLVDHAERATKSSINFLWTTFTRFEPTADIHAREIRMKRHQGTYTPPIVIDARMKSWYPEELFCDEATATKVTARWNEYFPDGMEMGNSDRGHMD